MVSLTGSRRISLPGGLGGSSTSKTTRDGVNSATSGRVGRGDVGASQLGVMVCGMAWVFVVARVAGGRRWSERGG